MPLGAENGKVDMGGAEMPFARFGQGERTLVILPGLSDGLAMVKGKALLLAPPYRRFFGRFTVYMFSRKDPLPEGSTIRDMADDQAEALNLLGIEKTSVLGVSQGGMIAQYMAIDHPGLVEKLVIAVSSPCCGELTRERVSRWIDLVRKGDRKGLMTDTAEHSYSQAYLKKYRRIYPVIGAAVKPKDHSRFLANAEAILGFDAREELCRIACPTLIIGAEEDDIAGPEGSRELKRLISESELYMYPGLGHAAYEEAEDFNDRVFSFLERQPRPLY